MKLRFVVMANGAEVEVSVDIGRLYVHLEGGMVEKVSCTHEALVGLGVTVLDMDVDGVAYEDLGFIIYKDARDGSFCNDTTLDVTLTDVEKIEDAADVDDPDAL